MMGQDEDAETLLEVAEKRWQYQKGWGPQAQAWKADLEFLRGRLARHRGEIRLMQQHLVASQQAGYEMAKITREQTLAQAQLGEMRDAERQLAELLSDPQGDEPEVCHLYP